MPNLPPSAGAPKDKISGFVESTVGSLRRKLLDLTGRNPLLSFRHSSKSRRYVRVIDELPDQLFQRLSDDDWLKFRSIGEEASEPEDERTMEFQRALEEGKLEDAEYLKQLEELGDEPSEKSLERLESELRVRMRAQLGMPPRKAGSSTTAQDIARRRGLDPSFDLSANPTEPEENRSSKHSDSYIQTLLFNEAMERTLARLREHVRLSIDETGINPLFCVFGFLEWYEDSNSEIPLHSPLLLFPIDIDRELVLGHYQYKIHSQGEDASMNVALAERLKRDFEIILPAFEEDDSPEKYFLKVQRVIERHKSWKVRRWITIGTFSFARIAMFHDLDPEKWKDSGGFSKHPVLSKIIGGAQPEPQAEHLRVDNVTLETDLPAKELDVPLIADADSSQLAAVCDVLSGRNLVIEGPPGTGKSQTITNIIAGALNAGKTVLFLAEKMTALNVVRDRLKDAHLENFCLELHSTKANRSEIFASLGRRLNWYNRDNVTQELRLSVDRAHEIRKRLLDCVEGLSLPAGQLGITAQQLLWRCDSIRQRTMGLPPEIDDVAMHNADKLSEMELGRIVVLAERFAQLRKQLVDTHGSIQFHPWNGIARHDIDPFRAEAIGRRVSQLAEAASRAKDVLELFRNTTEAPADRLSELEDIAKALQISAPDNAFEDEIASRMAQPQIVAAVEHFVEEQSNYRILKAQITSEFSSPETAGGCHTSDLRSLLVCANLTAVNDARVSELPELIQAQERSAAAAATLDVLINKIIQDAGLDGSIDIAIERKLVAAVRLASELSQETLARRQPSVCAAGTGQLIRSAVTRSATIIAMRQELSARYAVENEVESTLLRGHAGAIRSAPLVPIFNAAWRRARKCLKGLSKSSVTLSRQQQALALDNLAKLKDDLRNFNGDQDLLACLGKEFRGVDTEFGPLVHLADWADRVRTQISGLDYEAVRLRILLLEGPADQIQALASHAMNPSFTELERTTADPSRQVTVTEQQQREAIRLDTIRQAKNVAERVALRPQFRLSGCQRLLDDIEETERIGQSLDTNQTISRVIGETFQGRGSSVTALVIAARYVKSVLKSGVNPAMKNWLFAGESKKRYDLLRAVADQSQQALVAIKDVLAALSKVAQIDYLAWLNVSSPMDVTAEDLHRHASRCAANPEELQLLIDDSRALHEAAEAGLGPLIDLFLAKKAPLGSLGDATRRIIYQSVARAVIARNSALANFVGNRHEAERKEFCEIDHKLKKLRQASIAKEITSKAVQAGNGTGPKKEWTGLALIRNEVGKQKRHISIRDLLDRSGSAVQQLMPCFMMSPLTVAQFLKPGQAKFDLIIMDEASQLRPEDAIGAIGRGTQLVVVGDPKQLPPTNFFMGNDGAGQEGEDGGTIADEQSILDQAMAVLHPPRRLKWHYRSRHGSLIAFSNREFYDGELVVFPSPYHDHADYGLKYVHLLEGRYRNRVNVIEAKRVAEAAVEYATKHPKRSLAIVTLSWGGHNQPGGAGSKPAILRRGGGCS